MADYKERLKETLNNLSEIARDLGDTAQDLARDLGDNAKEWTENAQEKAREFTGAAAERARDLSDAANERAKNFSDGDSVKDLADKAKKLRSNARAAFEANGINEELKKAYMEIGKLYYETADGEPGYYFDPLFRKVRQLNEQLDALNTQMNAEDGEPEPETVIAEDVSADEPSGESE